jgi:transglutaminase-like putative cysteine protease
VSVAVASAMRYRVTHLTRYDYSGEVLHSHQLLRLKPREMPHQVTLSHSLSISPAPTERHDEQDAFGNPVTRVQIDRPHASLEVEARMDVEARVRPPRPADETQPWRELAESLRYSARPLDAEAIEVQRYRTGSPFVRIKRVFEEYAGDCFEGDRPVLECAEALMHRIHRDFTYSPGATRIGTPLPEVLASRRGVCQDYAHVMIACLRARGLPARYVSGYVRTVPLDGSAGRPMVGADASHAWVAVWAPPFGWVALDPTNDRRVGPDHVTLAWGRDFGDVSPLRGVILGGGAHLPTVRVSVQPLAATP